MRILLMVVAVAAAMIASGCSENAASTTPRADKTAVGKSANSGGQRRAHLVEVAAAVVDSLRITSVYTGSLRSRRIVRVFNQEEGRITSLPFFEGDHVAEGQVILEIDDALLRAELDKAKAVRREAESNIARLKRLRDSRMISEDEYLRAATAVEVAKAEEAVLQTRLGYTRVRAPFPGVVAARLAERGDIVPRHSHVLTLIDPTRLLTDLQVSELLIPHLAVGDTVTVRIDALGDRVFEGAVLRIHPEVDARTRQGRVEIALQPAPDGARPGQFARVTFSVEALDRKVLPFSALRRDNDGEFIFLMEADNRVKRVPVRSGRRLADRVEILKGVEAGDRVVVKGFLGLVEGMEVKPVGVETRPEGTTG